MNQPQKILKSIEKIAERQFIPTIGPIKGEILIDVIKKYNPKLIVEIGALFGYSVILMTLHSNAEIITIEINKNNAEITRENVKKAGYEDRIKVIQEDALDILPNLNKKIDLLFIDAVKEDYYNYLKLAEKNLRKGSIVIADNVGIFKDAMEDYLDYVRNSGNYKTKTISVLLEFHRFTKDAMEVSEKL